MSEARSKNKKSKMGNKSFLNSLANRAIFAIARNALGVPPVEMLEPVLDKAKESRIGRSTRKAVGNLVSYGMESAQKKKSQAELMDDVLDVQIEDERPQRSMRYPRREPSRQRQSLFDSNGVYTGPKLGYAASVSGPGQEATLDYGPEF